MPFLYIQFVNHLLRHPRRHTLLHCLQTWFSPTKKRF